MNDYIITFSPYEGVNLEHKSYKYIQRKWVNGRWQYTYPKTIVVAGTREARDTYAYNAVTANQIRQTANKQSIKTIRNAYSRMAVASGKDAMVARNQMHMLQAREARLNSQAAKKIIKELESKPISKLQTAYNKGKDLVASLIKKAGNAVNKLIKKIK